MYTKKNLFLAQKTSYKNEIYIFEPILFAIQKIGPTLTNQGIFV